MNIEGDIVQLGGEIRGMFGSRSYIDMFKLTKRKIKKYSTVYLSKVIDQQMGFQCMEYVSPGIFIAFFRGGAVSYVDDGEGRIKQGQVVYIPDNKIYSSDLECDYSGEVLVLYSKISQKCFYYLS